MPFRVFFAIAVFFNLDINQMNVKTAFLYRFINQIVYVEILKSIKIKANRNLVCKLLKALYGLKQSLRLWYKKLANFFLEKLSLKRINVDHSIFVTKANLDRPVVSIFVDDIKIMAPKGSEMIERVKIELIFTFFMIDMGPISFYWGLKVQQDWENQTIKLLQPAYINKVLNKFYLDKTHAINTSMKETALFKQRTEGDASPSEIKCYQDMTGFLMFSMIETKPNIAFVTFVASRFAKNLGHQYTEAVKTILQYLKGSNK